MTNDIRLYMENLAEVTADRERIATELNVAKQIQASMLPSRFPAFPDRKEFDLYALMEPAREVGGDFYDFFMIDDRHLAIVIADVSGKGVPAALFMVIAKTLIKNQSGFTKTPSEILETVNNKLLESNDAGLFVTVFMGVLETDSGRFIYSNAGHNPPLISHGGKGFEPLKTDSGFVLAGIENFVYTTGEIVLSPGDRLVLFTDGVTEALNPREELFGDRRLADTLNRSDFFGLGTVDLVHSIRKEVDVFADGAPQADDITIMALAYKGQ
jgi:sigma-B regulation protein RsbU (phosphoserine phosphatase)